MEWDQIASPYAAADSDLSLNRTIGDEYVLGFLSDWKGKTVLDVGCGTGSFVAKLRTKGARAWGTDGSLELLKIARERHPSERFEHVDLERAPAGRLGETVEVVTCAWTLPFVDDLRGALRFFGNQLQEKGRLIVALQHPFLPLAEKLQGRSGPQAVFEGFRNYSADHSVHFHAPAFRASYRFRSVSSYLNAFAEAGFRLEKIVESSLEAVPDEKLGQYLPLKSCPIGFLTLLRKDS